MDIAEIGFKADTSDLRKAEDDLDDLTKEAIRADKQVRKTAKGF